MNSQGARELYRQRALTDNSPRSKFQHFCRFSRRNVLRLGIAAAMF